MFYQGSQLTNFLSCKKCNTKYNKTNLPKNLPCGHILCTNCEDSQRKNSKTIKCIDCDVKHQFNEEIPLPRSEVLIEMLSLQPNVLRRSNDIEELIRHLNEINQIVDLIKHRLNGSVDVIIEHCIELRRQVQLATEQKIKEFNEKMNKFNEKLMNEIKKYENECCAKFMSPVAFQKTTVAKQLIESKDFTSKWTSNLNELSIDDALIKQANQQATTLISRLKNSLEDLKNFVFNDHVLEFEQNCQELNDSMLGYLSSIKMDTLVLDNKQKVKLMSLFPIDKGSNKWSLLYRGSRDGLDSNAFHSKCDNNSKLLVVVETTDRTTLGGYTDLNWMVNGTRYTRYKSDPNAFIFKLNSSSNDFINYSYSKKSYNSIRCDINFGPCFGIDDIFIDLSRNLDSYEHINSYKTTSFEPREIEVFAMN